MNEKVAKARIRVAYKSAPGEPKIVRRTVYDITLAGTQPALSTAYYTMATGTTIRNEPIEYIFDGWCIWQRQRRAVRGYSQYDDPKGVDIWRLKAT